MQQINNLSDDADQIITFVLPDASTVLLEFVYRPAIQRWSVDVTHADLPGGAIHGFNLCLGPNILRQWRNVIPFGIAITSAFGVDPTDVEDFVNGNISVFVLTIDELAQVESDVLGAIPLVNP